MSRWYVSIENKASGPFEIEEIVDSIKQRKYVLVDLVYEEGGSGWQSFDEVTEFKKVFEELKAQDESRSKAQSYLKHPWVILKKNPKSTNDERYLQEGPFSSDEVLRQLSNGKIDYTDYAWKKGFDKWVRIGFIPEFDRMKDIDENSFYDYKVPLPEMSDSFSGFLNESKESSEDILKSVRILKKDETYYKTPEDDPDFANSISAPNFSEVEVTSVQPMEKTVFEEPQRILPPPVETTARVIPQTEDTATTQPLPQDPENTAKRKARLFSGFGQKSTQKLIEKDAPTDVEPPAKKEKPPEKRTEKKPDKQLEKVVETETLAPTAIKESAKEKKEKLPEKLPEKPPEKQLDKQIEKRASLEEPTVLVKRASVKRSYATVVMSIGAILVLAGVVIFGLYNYHVFGENSAIDRWAQNTQRALQKKEELVKPARREEPKEPEPTTALDPNMKNKVESQLESGANQKLPDTNVPPPPPPSTPAPVQEIARGGNQKATYVDLDFKNFTKNSKVSLMTNGPNGTLILLYVSARTGEILTFPSFYHEFKVTKKANKNPEIDLASLPPGRYNLEAEIGDLKKLKVLTVKDDDFIKKIEAHMKQVSYEQQKEKKALFYGAKSLEILVKKFFDTARTMQAPSKEWSSFYTGFRQNAKASLSSLVTSLNDTNRNNYAYPDELFDLLDLRDSLLKNADEVDKDLKAKKPIEGKTEQDMFRDLEKIRKRAAALSVRKSNT